MIFVLTASYRINLVYNDCNRVREVQNMLFIRVGEFTKDVIVNVSVYFNFMKKREWFDDPFVRRVIKEIDKSEVINGEYIESPVFGGISPDRLSSGTKALILMRCDSQYTVYATRCGDNCFPFIKELSESQDVHIMLHHCPTVPEEFNAIFLESGIEVKSRKEFVDEYYKIRHQITGV